MPAIRHILADIGVVTLDMDLPGLAFRMAVACDGAVKGGSAGLARAFYEDPMLADYECGRVDRGAFVDHFRAKLGFRGGREEFVAIWRSAVSPNLPMIDFWRSLAGRADLWYFSNTGEMHVPWIYEAFPAMVVHKGHALSFELGVMKPDPLFFRRGMERLGLSAEECLFIDDQAVNCDAARSCGIESIHYTTADAALAALRTRLELP